MAIINTLTNRLGMSVILSTFGASIVDIYVPLNNGKKRPITIHPLDMTEFLVSRGYYGKTIGRNAGRIANGRFYLENHEYEIVEEKRLNGLHGGTHGLAFNDFVASPFEKVDGQGIVYVFDSPHLYDGFPGNLHLEVTYFLMAKKNRLCITFNATCDRTTICNLTNHTYFNLDGQGTILHHTLQIPASKYLLVDEHIMPKSLAHVRNTMDFRKPKQIGKAIFDLALIQTAGGYDHPFLLDDQSSLHLAAALTSSTGDVTMQILTSYPVLVFYSGNYPTKEIMNTGKTLAKYEALALEPQFLPDAINNAYGQTKTGLLQAGQTYHEVIEYEFVMK